MEWGPHAVTVAAEGFHWNGKPYASLRAVATAITGVHWSGPRFFKLDEVMREKTA